MGSGEESGRYQDVDSGLIRGMLALEHQSLPDSVADPQPFGADPYRFGFGSC
jgi:hypothetical protein